jgi:uncharacterized protein
VGATTQSYCDSDAVLFEYDRGPNGSKERTVSHESTENGWSPQGPVTELSDAASWGLLRGRSFGRLGLSDNNQPEIFPVNFVCDGETILFRTAPGSKLRELTQNRAVAFEVDAEIEGGVWSVVVKGHAVDLNADPILSAEALATLPPWIPTQPFVFIRIAPSTIRGRLFERHLPIGHV